jgi:hypothetical protein
MKTQWEFWFESRDLLFPHERVFEGRGSPPGEPEIVFEVRLVPDREAKPPDVDDAGRVLITLPGRPAENEEFAYHLVHRLAQQISFPHGHVKILGGMVTATRIAETADEQIEIGDKPHVVKVRLEEVPRYKPEFDASTITQAQIEAGDAALLLQFNSAKQLSGPVERFLGFFKVLEKAYATKRDANLLVSLRASDELFQLARTVLHLKADGAALSREKFDELLKTWVRIRDNCAHLRNKTGYSPGDTRLITEVEPHLGLVRAISQECVARRIRSEPR